MNIFQKAYWEDLNDYLSKIVPKTETSFTIRDTSKKTSTLKSFDYILLPHSLSRTLDVQSDLEVIKSKTGNNTKIVIVTYNFLWKPVLDVASLIGFARKQTKEPNWLSSRDIENFLYLAEYELVRVTRRYLMPIPIPYVSSFINRFISPLPFISRLSLNTIYVAKPKKNKHEYSVSIIIPARNEEGNMKNIFRKIPKLGTQTELIFVEGGSTDETFSTIENEIQKNKTKIPARLFKQKGTGKGDAVRLGFSKAKNDVLMILDADLTVPPKDLHKFYESISSGKADFINGSRLVYSMESKAMQTLNYFANYLFGHIFTFLIGQNIKDTLCGTKVLLKKDYMKIVKGRKYFGDFDPFGDFDLLFGAARLHLKIIDLPVRYRDRVYGETNINRFRHGFLLLKMAMFATIKLKFI